MSTDEIDATTRLLARVEPGKPGGDPSAPEARALLVLITAGDFGPAEEHGGAVPGPRRVRRYGPQRLLLGLVAVAVLAAGVVVGPSLLGNGLGPATSYASSDIDIRREADLYVARIKNPYADHQRYREAFGTLGLDVDVRVVPAAPRKVGQELSVGVHGGVRESSGRTPEWLSSGMEEPDGTPCMAGQDGCYLVLRVPVGLTGQLVVRLGRPARAGEVYDEAGVTTATTAGGTLAGYRVDEKTVGEVVPEIEKRGLKITYLIATVAPENPGGYGMDPDKQDTPVGKDWIVWEAEESAPDTVRLIVTDERYDKNPVYGGPRDTVVKD
ncbi:hypothetical protein DQ384_15900 [Sphaerisporangium album]|uniref:Uncharacterized protein n=1 Tax=Sphaerisporangium album TaxID=509200 RepID=A0A367FJZ7_9ACTN|nr:hypothetical protein [Sphaerisporangium album]RCG30229.1 hypothetical protein DQ384_15900 [Sphaerisporangium album]